ncbi:amidase [Pelotalea chapellei]|uniref:N-acetylmuramoyl-L-alanine amidase n=1 Tax=Pelotalea chapellei TaxID=44671 RepID=A0ABS5U7L8_9BACT|nr:amidase [Pelotalea chapellei]MBT1071661.1 N-acetylmuramoyl-L-alanine amidase [Pelotalea chapellei]
MQTKYGFHLLTIDEFDRWLQTNLFNRAISLLQNHHTWLPDYGTFTGSNHFALMKSMNDAHLERGFDMIAQNITTFPDGTLAVCRPLDRVPAGIKGANSKGICIEHLGNFDNKDTVTALHHETIIRVNALLCREFSLIPTTSSIVYHHWFDLTTGERTNGSGTTKSCPGTCFFGGNTVETAAEHFIPQIVTAASGHASATNPSSTSGGEQAIVTANPTLNIRCSPSSDARSIGSLRRGSSVNVYARQDNWCRIHPKESHWVAARYLEF